MIFYAGLLLDLPGDTRVSLQQRAFRSAKLANSKDSVAAIRRSGLNMNHRKKKYPRDSRLVPVERPHAEERGKFVSMSEAFEWVERMLRVLGDNQCLR